MKKVVVVVAVVALFGFFHKHKKRQPAPPPSTRTPISMSCGSPDAVAVDTARVGRIVQFGLRLRRTPQVDEPTLQTIATHIYRYASSNCVEPELAAALIARESSFNPMAVSSSNAKGLGQLKDGTAQEMGVTDSFDIEQNVRGTTGYLKKMLNFWNGYPDQVERALASYNLGATTVRINGPAAAQQFVSDILGYRDRMLAQ